MADEKSICEKISKHQVEIEKVLQECNKPLSFCSENFDEKLNSFKQSAQTNSTGTIEDYPIMAVDEINLIFKEMKTLPSWCEKANPLPPPKPKLNRTLSLSQMSLNQTRNQSIIVTPAIQTRNQSMIVTPAMQQKPKPKVEWNELISRIHELQTTLSRCKTGNVNLKTKLVGEKRLKLIKAFKESLGNIQQMKKWLENALVDASNPDSKEMVESLQELNENMKEVAHMISNFGFIQEHVHLPVADLKVRDVKSKFEDQIMGLCELLAELHKDESELK